MHNFDVYDRPGRRFTLLPPDTVGVMGDFAPSRKVAASGQSRQPDGMTVDWARSRFGFQKFLRITAEAAAASTASRYIETAEID